MVRRLRIAVLSTLAIAGAVTLVFLGGVSLLLRTEWGKRAVQSRVERAVAAAFEGRGALTLSGLVLSPLGTASLDSATLRDASGAVLARLGALRVEYGIGPLLDRELRLRLVRIDGLRVAATQDSAGHWDLTRLLARGDTAGAPVAAPAGAGWRITLDSLLLTNGGVRMTRVRADTGGPTALTLDGLGVALGPSTYRLAEGDGTLTLRHVAVDLNAPPVLLRHAEGTITLARDAARVDLAAVHLPGSRARLAGTVGWGDAHDAPQLDLTLRADTVDLADIGWISTLVPAEGRGRAVVRVRNGPGAGEIRYAIQDLDIASGDSRLTGRFVADVGESMAIRDLDITAAPLDLALVRELFGEGVPPTPWDGALRGRLRATGGALDAWRLDPSTIEFEDRRVGGARSRLTIAGTLDLLAEQATLAPLEVVLDSVDIRTVGAVSGIADSLGGSLAGRVVLEGPTNDIRFRDLYLVHHDGALPRSVVRGSGRIGTDTTRVWLDAALALDTIGIAAFGKAFTTESLAGTVHGTLDVSAIRDSVTLDLDVQGEGATLRFAGATSLDTTRLVLQGTFGVQRLDARRFVPAARLPAHRITATATLGIDGPRAEPSGPLTMSIDAESELAGLTLRDGRAILVLEPGGLRVDTLALEGPVGRVSARGRLSRDPTLRDALRFDASLDSIALLRGFLPDSLAAAWADSLGGRAHISGVALGSLDTVDVRATLEADHLRAGGSSVARLDAELLLDGVPRATRGLVTFDATELVVATVPIAQLSATATVREPTWTDVSLRMVAGDTLVATARSELRFHGDSLTIRLDSLDATTHNAQWSLRHAAAMVFAPGRTTIDSLELRSADGGRFALALQLGADGPIVLRAHLERVPLAHARFTGLLPPRVDGLVSLDADVSGTRAAPRLTLTAALDSTRVDGLAAPSVAFTGEYADLAANITVVGAAAGREAFRVVGELPLDLAFEERRLVDRLIAAPLYLRLSADGSPLAGMQALIPGVRDLEGGFDAQVQVSGQWNDLEPRGYLILRDGAFSVPALETGFRELDMDISLAPDSIVLQHVRLADERSSSDTATVTGTIVRTAGKWGADITTRARNLRAIDDPRVAEADVSWQLHLHGPLDSLRLEGVVTVPVANVFIGQQRRRVLVLEEDVVSDQAARYAPRLDGVQVRLGNEVRLRSPEANVQLTGAVEVAGTLDAPEVRGEIVATRGTYRLDLGLLQRTFQVDSGRVRMNGPLSNSPTLDIHTSYLVRQAEREDVRIGARLTGTVEQPRLVLSSADVGSTASETELISYLLFGAPSFVLDGQSASAVRLATAALVPSLGGAAERALGGRIPFISELQVTTVAGDSPRDFTLNSFEGLLNSFALTAGTQIGPDSYLRLSGGVCRGENRAAQSLPAWFGIAAEYRPVERLSAQVSLTPGSSPCNRIGTFAQIYQFGLDLFRDWRW